MKQTRQYGEKPPKRRTELGLASQQGARGERGTRRGGGMRHAVADDAGRGGTALAQQAVKFRF
eukprot:3464666-Pleurochrysis_carterae.AAC.1